MSIVTPQDFVGEITIAQVEQLNVNASVQEFITKYEAEYLKKVLGHTLYTAYNAGIEANTPLYLSLRDGGIYVDYYGDTVNYEGLKYAIANYIYYHYIRNNATVTTGSGEQDLQKASSMDKQVRAWNTMVSLNKSLRAYIRSTPDYGYVSHAFNEMFIYENTLGL